MVQVQGERDLFGNTVPLGKATLEGLRKNAQGQNQTYEVEISHWMSGTFIQELFPELFSEIPNGSTASPQNSLASPSSTSKPPSPTSSRKPFARNRRFKLDSGGHPTINQQTLEEPQAKEINSVDGTTENPFSNIESKRKETVTSFMRLKQRGVNKENIIYQLWEVTKGGSDKWKYASAMYEEMDREYQAFLRGDRGIDELF